ncbi:GNAT family N-acetyltransferase [Gemmatimonadota bacterium]
MNKDWKNEVFEKPDYSEIAELRSFFNDPDRNTWRKSTSSEYYHWKLWRNYIDRGLLHVADFNSQVVGMASITPKTFIYKGEILSSGELGDCFINPQYNQKGMFASLLASTKDSAIEKGMQFIYGTPNSAALPGERKAGYDIIPSLKVINAVYPINAKSVFSEKTDLKLLVNLVGPFIKMGLYLIFLFNSLIYRKTVDIVPVTVFPEEMDDLFDKCSINYDCILERNKHYLDWRYCDNPDEYSMYLIKINHGIVGYIITKIGSWNDLKVGYVGDYLIDPQHMKYFPNAILHVLSIFRKSAVDMVSVWTNRDSKYYKTLRKFGFLKFKSIPVICYKNDLGTQMISSELKWHFTMADSDNI